MPSISLIYDHNLEEEKIRSAIYALLEELFIDEMGGEALITELGFGGKVAFEVFIGDRLISGKIKVARDYLDFTFSVNSYRFFVKSKLTEKLNVIAPKHLEV